VHSLGAVCVSGAEIITQPPASQSPSRGPRTHTLARFKKEKSLFICFASCAGYLFSLRAPQLLFITCSALGENFK